MAETVSETLFEEYLSAHGYTDWQHEEKLESKSGRLDYNWTYNGQKLFFEVKEFAAEPMGLSQGAFVGPFHFDVQGRDRRRLAVVSLELLKGSSGSLVE